MKVALIHNWPGSRNAELDLIGRMHKVLTGLGHDPTVIDPFGNPLDLAGELIGDVAPLDGSAFDFCLNLHFNNPQWLDCFSYAVNWNPVAYLLRDPNHGTPQPRRELLYLAACLAGHDLILSAGSAETDQLVAALAERPNPAAAFPDLRLHTGCQSEESVAPVSLDDFRVFYIGVNWERIVDSSRSDRRHGGLLERLDANGRVDFYGVAKVCGIEPWKGFRNYRGELPFDNGMSIIRTANRCGVSLVLSSPQHRASGLVSMRIFQACAARTVVISDDNPFIVENFGDTVLTFEYSTDPALTCERIERLIGWIEQHQEEAAAKAERAHRIFTERFALNRELGTLLERHAATVETINDQILPSDRTQTVDVILNLVDDSDQELDRFIGNLNRQTAVRPHGLVCCRAARVAQTTERLREKAHFVYTVVAQDPANTKTGAAVLRAVTDHAKGEAFCIDQPATRWHSRHLALMLRVLQSGSTLVSQTHGFIRNQAIRSHAFNRSLAGLAIGHEMTMLRPDHLAGFRIDAFSPAAFLFHRKLVVNQFERARDLVLFDVGAAFFLLTLNWIAYGTLPDGTSRYSFRRDRDDDLFALYQMNDPLFFDQLQVEIALLGALFRRQAAGRELAASTVASVALDAATGVAGNGGGFYAYLVTTLRSRPLLKRVAVGGYGATRRLLGLPPYPPKVPD